jgi:hypothetical protein
MSTLRLTTISNQDGSATVPSQTVISGSAKVWVNFNGTGTPAIRGSFNVSSITDNGTGIYTVNFTNALVDANYSAVAICTEAQTRVSDGTAPTTSAVHVKTNSTDSAYISVAVFR